MRLGVLLDRYGPTAGGAEAHTDALVRRALERGGEVVVAVLEGVAPPGATTLRVVAPRRRPARDRAFAAAGVRRLRAAGCSVVLGFRHCPGVDVYLPHGGLVAESAAAWDRARAGGGGRLRRLARALSPKARFFRRAEQVLLSGPTGPTVVCLSEALARRMREAYPAVASRQVVIPGGVDTARFRREPFAEAGRRLRLSLGLVEAYVGLLLARHPRLKGADAAVLALARPEVRSLTPPFHLWVAGGALPGGLRRRARRLGVAGWIRETGGTEDPRPLYAAADLLVHPTHYDPCSLVGLEALAMGLPVLTTAANGIVELMDGGRRGGALLEAATPEAVARGIVRFVDADRRRVAAEEARAVAVANPLADRLDRLLAACGARTS